MKMLHFDLLKSRMIPPKAQFAPHGGKREKKSKSGSEEKARGDFSLFGRTNGFPFAICNVEIESQSVHLLHCAADTPFWPTEGGVGRKNLTLVDCLRPLTYRQLAHLISEPECEDV